MIGLLTMVATSIIDFVVKKIMKKIVNAIKILWGSWSKQNIKWVVIAGCIIILFVVSMIIYCSYWDKCQQNQAEQDSIRQDSIIKAEQQKEFNLLANEFDNLMFQRFTLDNVEPIVFNACNLLRQMYDTDNDNPLLSQYKSLYFEHVDSAIRFLSAAEADTYNMLYPDSRADTLRNHIIQSKESINRLRKI